MTDGAPTPTEPSDLPDGWAKIGGSPEDVAAAIGAVMTPERQEHKEHLRRIAGDPAAQAPFDPVTGAVLDEAGEADLIEDTK